MRDEEAVNFLHQASHELQSQFTGIISRLRLLTEQPPEIKHIEKQILAASRFYDDVVTVLLVSGQQQHFLLRPIARSVMLLPDADIKISMTGEENLQVLLVEELVSHGQKILREYLKLKQPKLHEVSVKMRRVADVIKVEYELTGEKFDSKAKLDHLQQIYRYILQTVWTAMGAECKFIQKSKNEVISLTVKIANL